MEEIDIGKFEKVKIIAGSHNHITIEKLYGPTVAKDLKIVWENNGWNVINRRRVKEAIEEIGGTEDLMEAREELLKRLGL